MKLSYRSLFLCLALLFLTAACAHRPRVETEVFGTLSTGEEVMLYRLVNRQGAVLEICDYGARIVSLWMPDRDGRLDDVIVGYGDLPSFENGDRFFGPVIGRYANRIDHASFTLDGKQYMLDANELLDGVPVHAHGGREGFDRRRWTAVPVQEEGRAGVRLSLTSPDGDQGFPGCMEVSVSYWLTDDNVLIIDYGAETDAPTVINLCNHAYFNLKGAVGGYVMDHLLQVEADSCVLNNSRYCPESLFCVEGTPFDFREAHPVDYCLDWDHPQLARMHGMSACWKLRDWDGSLRRAAALVEPISGRAVEVWTTEPALLIFTGRTFSAEEYPNGKYGPIRKYGGMPLETIHFPDSPNQNRFPSTVLRPGEHFHSTTEFRFSTR